MTRTKKTKTSLCQKCIEILAVPSRFKLYEVLKTAAKQDVVSLTASLGLTQPTVSYHLKEMQKAGLLSSTKEGKHVYYSISAVCPSYNRACVFKNINFHPEGALVLER